MIFPIFFGYFFPPILIGRIISLVRETGNFPIKFEQSVQAEWERLANIGKSVVRATLFMHRNSSFEKSVGPPGFAMFVRLHRSIAGKIEFSSIESRASPLNRQTCK